MNDRKDSDNKKGMKIFMDLVAGHTSDKHPWFLQSKQADKNLQYSDYFIWTPTKAEKPKQLVKYTKEQILAAKKYRNRRDLLGVLLVDEREYELEEVEQWVCQSQSGASLGTVGGRSRPASGSA